MPQDYPVKQGDCMSSIAFNNGFFWQTLWNDSSNSDLKSKRKDPNVLMPGDTVHIPDLTVKQEPGATESQHRFKKKGVPEKLRIKLLDAKQNPRANLAYIIIIDGVSRNGTTNGNGELTESIPPNAHGGELRLGADQNEVIPLKLGHLDPVVEASGAKARLANLGFYRGPIDGTNDDDMKAAVAAFQDQQGLQPSGSLDDPTQQKLLQAHGH